LNTFLGGLEQEAAFKQVLLIKQTQKKNNGKNVFQFELKLKEAIGG
jgi:hypothetical protein